MHLLYISVLLIVAGVHFAPSHASSPQTEQDIPSEQTLHRRNLLASKGDIFKTDKTDNHRLTPFLLKLASKKVKELQEPAVIKLLGLVRKLGEDEFSSRQLQDTLKQIRLTVKELRKPKLARTYPVTRRITLAVVFDAHNRLTSWWTRGAQMEVDGIAFEFYQLYRDGVKSQGIVQFQHVSKCGGTSMCQAAKKAGCVTQEFSMSWNCRVKVFGDTPLWSEKSIIDPSTTKRHFPFFSRGWPFRPPRDQLDNCVERQRYLKETGFNFFANELYLVEGLVSPVDATPCEQFNNVIVLRRPVPRVLSNLKHINAYYMNMHATPPTGLKAINETAPAVLDNYTLRMLLGHWIFDLKLGAVNEAHLELARLKLQEFDLILLLEEPDAMHVLMRYGLGWNTTMRDIAPVNVGSALTTVASPELGLSEQDVKVIEDLNKHETNLYSYAKTLMDIDLAWLEASWKVAKMTAPELIEGIGNAKCGYISM